MPHSSLEEFMKGLLSITLIGALLDTCRGFGCRERTDGRRASRRQRHGKREVVCPRSENASLAGRPSARPEEARTLRQRLPPMARSR